MRLLRRVLAAIPILVIGPLGGFFLSIAATGLIYLSYFLCNIGVLNARRQGWPHRPAWFNLGRWGMLVNLLALGWGGLMIINIGLWTDPGLFGNFGGDGRGFTTLLTVFLKPFGAETAPDWVPAWPTFETLVGVILVTGLAYYLLAVRGTVHDVETADAATGEAVIG